MDKVYSRVTRFIAKTLKILTFIGLLGFAIGIFLPFSASNPASLWSMVQGRYVLNIILLVLLALILAISFLWPFRRKGIEALIHSIISLFMLYLVFRVIQIEIPLALIPGPDFFVTLWNGISETWVQLGWGGRLVVSGSALLFVFGLFERFVPTLRQMAQTSALPGKKKTRV